MNRNASWTLTDEQIVAYGIIAIGIFIALVVGLLVQYLFQRTLYRTLRNCREENRKMKLQHVWLNFVPFFATVWIFITVRRVAESLRSEFKDPEGDYSETLGNSYNVLFLLGVIPYIGAIFSTIGFVCFVVYWTRVLEHNAALKMKRACSRMPLRERKVHALPRFG